MGLRASIRAVAAPSNDEIDVDAATDADMQIVLVPHVVDPLRAHYDVYRRTNRNGQRAIRRALGPRYTHEAGAAPLGPGKYRFVGHSNVAVFRGLDPSDVAALRESGFAIVPNLICRTATAPAVQPDTSRPVDPDTGSGAAPKRLKPPATSIIALIDSGADPVSAGISKRLIAAWRWTRKGLEVVEPPSAITDNDTHGFHGTRTAAAAASDTHGPGTNADVAIIAVLRPMPMYPSLEGRSAAFLSDVLSGIRAAVELAYRERRPMVINMSLTFDPTVQGQPPGADADLAAIAEEIMSTSTIHDGVDAFFVAAAGNEKRLCFPASHAHVIAVGAHDAARVAWSASAEGICAMTGEQKPDFHTLGVHVTLPTPNGSMTDSGTSYACARFAGYLTTLPLGRFTGRFRHQRLYSYLVDRSTRISHSNGQGHAFGNGAVNGL